MSCSTQPPGPGPRRDDSRKKLTGLRQPLNPAPLAPITRVGAKPHHALRSTSANSVAGPLAYHRSVPITIGTFSTPVALFHTFSTAAFSSSGVTAFRRWACCTDASPRSARGRGTVLSQIRALSLPALQSAPLREENSSTLRVAKRVLAESRREVRAVERRRRVPHESRLMFSSRSATQEGVLRQRELISKCGRRSAAFLRSMTAFHFDDRCHA